MGFIHIGWIDIVDILAVAILMYYIYKMAKGTNAPSIITGIIIIYILWVLTRALNMELLSMILGNVIGVGVIALIVVFQPEIRQFLHTIGIRQRAGKRSSYWKKLFGGGRDDVLDITPIVRATLNMSAGKVGALIVIQQESDLRLIAETGIAIDAQVSASLLENIFFKNAPLHDGAVIIRENRIVAAKCVLPSTRTQVPKNYGMRHRAALGLSENSDAVVVVVSEETGAISIAHGGEIFRRIPADKFHNELLVALSKAEPGAEQSKSATTPATAATTAAAK